MDAVDKAVDNNIYAFKSDLVFKLTRTGIAPGFPKPIRAVFPKAPLKVDAVFTVNRWQATYILSGNRWMP
jgi:hypothetical protein